MAHRLLQIPLGISLRETASFDAFIARDNSQALTDIKNCAAGTGEQFLYLWGAPGVGKSHLLQAACRAAQRGANRVAYVPLSQVDEFSPEILSGLGALDLVCLDDIQRAGGDAEWERGLFTLFNQLRDRGAPLIVAADAPQPVCRSDWRISDPGWNGGSVTNCTRWTTQAECSYSPRAHSDAVCLSPKGRHVISSATRRETAPPC